VILLLAVFASSRFFLHKPIPDTASPVHTFNLDNLSVLDGAVEGYIRMPSIVEAWLFPRGLLQVDLESCPDFSGHRAGDAFEMAFLAISGIGL